MTFHVIGYFTTAHKNIGDTPNSTHEKESKNTAA